MRWTILGWIRIMWSTTGWWITQSISQSTFMYTSWLLRKQTIKTVFACLHILMIAVEMQVSPIPLPLFVCLLAFLEELSDEYQTDYDEEAVESALSDYEAFNRGSEHTEGEETVDTVETVQQKPTSAAQHSAFFLIPGISKDQWRGNSDIISLSFTGWRCSDPSPTQTENSPLSCSAVRFRVSAWQTSALPVAFVAHFQC